jgi:hypothetical protein
LTLEPASADLGNIDPGEVVDLTLVAHNVGSETSGSMTITRGPEVSSELSFLAGLQPGAGRAFGVTVTPSREGAFSSWVAIAANPGAPQPVQTTVSGMVAPWGPFTISAHTIDLGMLSLNDTLVRPITVTVREPVTDFSAKAMEAHVAIDSSTTCTASMAAGTTCTVAVKFVMIQVGPATASVEITATGAQPKTAVVRFSAYTKSGPGEG